MEKYFGSSIGSKLYIRNLEVESDIKTITPDVSLFGVNILSSNPLINLKIPSLKVKILDQINLLLKEGELCLVLGRPKQSNTELLRKIVEHSTTNNDTVFRTEIESFNQLIFNGEDDLHFPHLSVKQTLDLAIGCKLDDHFTQESKDQLISELLETFHLSHSLNTKIGDGEVVRGVSGGERRRVSIIEALLANGSITCLDNSTRGLDSTTALNYLISLKNMADHFNKTFICTLYQGSQSIFEQFDKVLVLYNGKQIYFGPSKDVESYFAKLGYVKRNTRQTTMELIDLILDDAIPFSHKVDIVDCRMSNIPKEAHEFHERWICSEEFNMLTTEIDEGIKEASIKGTIKKSRATYQVGIVKQFTSCFKRTFANNMNNYLYYVIQTTSFMFLAVCIGTLFLRLKMNTLGSFARGSVMYFCLLMYCFIAVSEVQKNFGNALIINKQAKNYLFYRPSIESLADILAEIPFKLIGMFFFIIIFYFTVGLKSSAGGFFGFWLFLFIGTLSINQLFHMISRLSGTVAIANSISGLVLLWLAMYASYVVQLNKMKVWFKYWLAYTNPLMYAFESMITLELNGQIMDCNNIIPSGSFYDSVATSNKICAWEGATLGNDFVRGEAYLSSSFGYSFSHVWRNLGILIGFFIGFVVFELIGSEVQSSYQVNGPAKLIAQTIKKGKIVSKSAAYDDDMEKKFHIYEEKDDDPIDCRAVHMWSDLSYTLDNGVTLIDKVNGFIKQGEFIALMGASGAGKTTLLNTISKRFKQGKISNGSVSIDIDTIAYVEQQELLIDQLTIKELLTIHLKVKSFENDDPYIERILELLGLKSYENFRIVGLNLELRKRVSLGIELVSKPQVLFVDEITSGMDNISAYNIIKCLKDLCNNAGISILCTIHQPSPTLIEQFDKILLLKKGRQTYFGPVDGILSYFENSKDEYGNDSVDVRPCGENENIADYIIDLMNEDIDWYSRWINSNEYKSMIEILTKTDSTVKSYQTNIPLNQSTKRAIYLRQLILILKRTYLEQTRNENYILSKLLLFIVSGLFVGFSFWKVDHSVKSLQSSMFAIFMILCVSSPLMHQIQDRCNFAKILYEQRESRLYHWSILPLCQLIVEIPLSILGATLSFLTFYFTWDINSNSNRTGLFYLTYAIMFQLYYVSFSIGVLYISPSLMLAGIFDSLLFSFLVVFCGAMQPFALIPSFWKYTVYYESPFTYFLQNLMSILFDGRAVICDNDEYALLSPQMGLNCGDYMKSYIADKGGYLKSATQIAFCTYCSYASGEEFTRQINMKYSQVWRNFGIFWIYVVFNVIAMLIGYYVTLKFKFKRGSFAAE
ncbi:hypothetical protein CANARDRAFT_197791 [[Candida] arabinofermentans NRRL YB-2248]|uniref:ABC transporter domain-containing protein n=1 Tax=[Candida] arabinofermentans NRRL YB-2248 TaxID=983967 RepID=A0A1E4T2U4_9ASCO|nr:hypothetical protein CANARDRAFT_197791 [[Candida] arabinofermentans NRRL YB-2248]